MTALDAIEANSRIRVLVTAWISARHAEWRCVRRMVKVKRPAFRPCSSQRWKITRIRRGYGISYRRRSILKPWSMSSPHAECASSRPVRVPPGRAGRAWAA